MAISKDLREYINKKRKEKIQELVEEKRILEKENRKKAVQSDLRMEELKDLFEQAQSVLTILNEEYKVQLDWRTHEIIKGNFGIEQYVPKELWNEGLEEIDKKIIETDKEYDALILKISMEKKFDVINSFLAEMGIDI